MQIQINTDHNIAAGQDLTNEITGGVEHALARFRGDVTRVEVHLSDENADKKGQDDKRCMMEARLGGLQPIAVTHQAVTLNEAVNAALEKLVRLIDSTLGRLHDKR